MTKNSRFSPAYEEDHFYGLVEEGKYLRKSLLYKQILPRPVRRSFSEGGTTGRPKTSVFSVPSVANNLFNLRNLLSINDLRLRILTYEIISKICKTKPIFEKVK
jgi:hypothetical protein